MAMKMTEKIDGRLDSVECGWEEINKEFSLSTVSCEVGI